MIGSGIGGVFLPFTFGSAVAAIGPVATAVIGSGGSFLFAAQANENWNPLK
jgi:hypothetical protein